MTLVASRPADGDVVAASEESGLDTIVAVVSLLHEPADRNSATRLFRDERVLRWTLSRIARASRIKTVMVLCWNDQRDAVEPIATELSMPLIVKVPRCMPGEVEATAAARRWSDGWRGGLLGTCSFDRGFYGPWVHEVAVALEADGVVLIDPAAGLIDGELIDGVIDHARSHPKPEVYFAPAAPGLCAPLLQRSLLERLAATKLHPGRMLHYHPDVIAREPLSGEGCAPLPTLVARTTRRFDLGSDRQIASLSTATASLNGELRDAGAETLVRCATAADVIEPLPREVVLELNTARLSRPVFWPGRYHEIQRPEMPIDTARRLIDELRGLDDTRLTIAGIGDPLLAANLFDVIAAAHDAGLAVHVETDLIGRHVDSVRRLAASGVDVVSVHLPALTDQTYASVMGVDAYRRVLEHLQAFVAERASLGRGVPLVVPLFTKCRDNLAEMEAWYDQWLRALGSAAIVGPSDYAGQMPDVAVADMTPPRRKPCVRLASRLTVLCDGQVVSCEQDFLGRQTLGNLATDSLRDVWQKQFASLRDEHRAGCLGNRPLCGACREWHRP